MYPLLFRIGPIPVHTYGVFVAAGFLAGLTVALRQAAREGIDSNRILDLSFYALIAAVVGSRVAYILVNPELFRNDPLEALRLWHGGLVFYGGFLAALAVLFWYVKHFRLPFYKTADIMAPALALGQSLGRLGCFFAGCCYGKPGDLPWCVTFTHPEALAPKDLALHPTQLYSAASNFAIFSALLLLRSRKRFDGQVLWLYVLLYAVSRFIVELFRGDDRGGFLWGLLSPAQALGALMACVALFMLLAHSRKVKEG